jgi:hypothetical protein
VSRQDGTGRHARNVGSVMWPKVSSRKTQCSGNTWTQDWTHTWTRSEFSCDRIASRGRSFQSYPNGFSISLLMESSPKKRKMTDSMANGDTQPQYVQNRGGSCISHKRMNVRRWATYAKGIGVVIILQQAASWIHQRIQYRVNGTCMPITSFERMRAQNVRWFMRPRSERR